MADTLYAEIVNYWNTSRQAPGSWIEKARREICLIGGTIIGEAFVRDEIANSSSFILEFQIGEDRFRMTWPVLQSKSGNVLAARRQSATALYHAVKSACVQEKFIGARTAFFAFLALQDGRIASQIESSMPPVPVLEEVSMEEDV